MSGRVFFDTNVLVYCDDPGDQARAKRLRAIDLVSELAAAGRAVISTQVMQEYYAAATRRLGVAADVARARVEALALLDVVLVRTETVLGAIDLHRLHRISFWDALIIRCASVAGCDRVYTEDLNHGQVIDGVRVENPFLAAAGRAHEGRSTWKPERRKRPVGRATARARR